MERFMVLGITHDELNIEEREIFFKNHPEKIIKELFESKMIKGYVNLSTCLRGEFYIELFKNEDYEKVVKYFKSQKGVFHRKGSEAIVHLFKVICGFESVIKGEEQILSQTKKSYYDSEKLKTNSKLINVIFNKAIHLGKKFRSESNICENALSLEAITIKFLKNKVEDISNKKILLLGIGDLSQSILKILIKDKHKNITITNRSTHTAKEIKEKYNCEYINFSEKETAIKSSDIVISITSAPHYIVRKKDIEEILEKKEYIFIDLAVPRDIEPEIGEIKNVNLYNLDDIWNIYDKNLKNRENLIEKYFYMLDDQLEKIKENLEYIKN